MPEPIKLPEPDLTMLSGPDYYTADTVTRLIAEAVAAEREACAALLDANADASHGMLRNILRSNAAAIRARTGSTT